MCSAIVKREWIDSCTALYWSQSVFCQTCRHHLTEWYMHTLHHVYTTCAWVYYDTFKSIMPLACWSKSIVTNTGVDHYGIRAGGMSPNIWTGGTPSRMPHPNIWRVTGCSILQTLFILTARQILRKNVKNRCHQMWSFKAKMHQTRSRPRLHPRTRWGSLQRFWSKPPAGFQGRKGKERQGKGIGGERKG